MNFEDLLEYSQVVKKFENDLNIFCIKHFGFTKDDYINTVMDYNTLVSEYYRHNNKYLKGGKYYKKPDYFLEWQKSWKIHEKNNI